MIVFPDSWILLVVILVVFISTLSISNELCVWLFSIVFRHFTSLIGYKVVLDFICEKINFFSVNLQIEIISTNLSIRAQERRLKDGVQSLVSRVQSFPFFPFFLTSIASRFLVTFLMIKKLRRFGHPLETSFFSFFDIFDFFEFFFRCFLFFYILFLLLFFHVFCVSKKKTGKNVSTSQSKFWSL